MIKMVKLLGSDIAIAGISLGGETRFIAIMMNYPFLFIQVSFVTDKPKLLPINLPLFSPFLLSLEFTYSTHFLLFISVLPSD